MRRTDERPEIPDEERERIARGILKRIQWGGAVFLAVVALGTVPALLADRWPALGRFAAIAIWILAPALGIGLLVLAAVRLRR